MSKTSDIQILVGGAVQKPSSSDLIDLLHIVAGKPDSITRRFPPAVVGMEDLRILDNKIREKLALSPISGATSSVSVTLEPRTTRAHKAFQDFQNADWDTEKHIESVLLTWDFLLEVAGEQSVHRIALRISETPKPMSVLQALMTRDPASHGDINDIFYPIVCHINFVNSLLAQELLNIVADWHASRHTPQIRVPLFQGVILRRDKIVPLCRAAATAVGAFVSLVFFDRALADFSDSQTIQIGHARYLTHWLVAIMLSFLAFRGVITWGARKATYWLEQTVNTTFFDITAGDRKRRTELLAKANRSFFKATAGVAGIVILNVLSSILACYLYHPK